MPTYSYRCSKCKKQFELILSMREYEEEKKACPKCGSEDVTQVVALFTAKTSRKS